MKKVSYVILLLVGLCLLAAPAMAGDFDGSQPLICAAVDVTECFPGGNCQKVTAEEVNLPDFLRLNFKDKKIHAQMAGRGDLETDIERVETVDGKLMVQGAEDGREDTEDGLAWSMAINQNDGKLVFTASGGDVAFVVFGACIVP
mgnify:CR=1 FL=1